MEVAIILSAIAAVQLGIRAILNCGKKKKLDLALPLLETRIANIQHILSDNDRILNELRIAQPSVQVVLNSLDDCINRAGDLISTIQTERKLSTIERKWVESAKDIYESLSPLELHLSIAISCYNTGQTTQISAILGGQVRILEDIRERLSSLQNSMTQGFTMIVELLQHLEEDNRRMQTIVDEPEPDEPRPPKSEYRYLKWLTGTVSGVGLLSYGLYRFFSTSTKEPTMNLGDLYEKYEDFVMSKDVK